MGKKFSRCIRQDTVGTAYEQYVGRIDVQELLRPVLLLLLLLLILILE
jgi:hypothetical protein